jgi:3-oxoacyl-[acyl-carrier-protein] synthase I
MANLAITGYGLVTGVGLSAPASCAAIRCAIDNFQETRFADQAGEWIIGSQVPLEKPYRGRLRLLHMAAAAITECLAERPAIDIEHTPLLLCLPELSRPGRLIDDDNQFFLDLQQKLALEFHEKSRIIASGHVSLAIAIRHAAALIKEPTIRQVLVAATDSLLVGATLAYFEERRRLLTSENSNGFIPGEAGAALILEPSAAVTGAYLHCTGLGFGIETAHVDSEEPLKAEGLTAAIKESLSSAQCEMGDLDFRISDCAGEQYHFKEASLAQSRTLRSPKESFDIWHPADCVGEVGAAQGIVMVSLLRAACEKGYSPGKKICALLGNDDGKRSSIIFSWQAGEANG